MEANRLLRISSGTERVEPVDALEVVRTRFGLTSAQAVVFEWMWRAVGGCESNGRSFRAVDIASGTGRSERTVSRSWGELVDAGLLSLRLEGHRGRAPVYAVHDPRRVLEERIVAAPAAEQLPLFALEESEASEQAEWIEQTEDRENLTVKLTDKLTVKMSANGESGTTEIAQAPAAQHLADKLTVKLTDKRALHDHEMSLLKISSHESAAARCAPPSERRAVRASNPPAESSAEESLIEALKRRQRERGAIHAPLPTLGSVLAGHAAAIPATAHGRDSPTWEPLVGDDSGAIGELAAKLQARTADPSAEWRLFVDLARDIVEKRLPFDVVKAWFVRMDRAGAKIESRGAVLRSNYKRFGRR